MHVCLPSSHLRLTSYYYYPSALQRLRSYLTVASLLQYTYPRFAQSIRSPANRTPMPKKQQQPQHYHDRPWTIARCNTLIRRLTQSIDDLRKLRGRPPIVRERSADRSHSDTREGACLNPDNYRRKSLKRKVEDTLTEDNDPIWAIRGSAKKRRSNKTYNARSSRQGGPTRTYASNVAHSENNKPYNGWKDVPARRPIKYPIDHDSYSALGMAETSAGEAIASALEEILEQTTPHSASHDGRKGEAAIARSASPLMDMCLRKIPQTIQMEECLRREEDPDDKSDVANEMMQLLLDHPFPYRKAAHLAEVTRARAVTMLQQVLEAGILRGNSWIPVHRAFTVHNRLREHEALFCGFSPRIQQLLAEQDSSELPQRLRKQAPISISFWSLVDVEITTGQLNVGNLGNSYFRNFRRGYDDDRRALYSNPKRVDVLLEAVSGMTNPAVPEEISYFALHILQQALDAGEARDECAEEQHNRMLCKLLVRLVAIAVGSELKLPATWPTRVAAETVHSQLPHSHVLASLLILTANLLLTMAGIYTTAGSAERTLDHFCNFVKLANDQQLSTAAFLFCLVTQELNITSSTKQTSGFTLFKQTLETLLSWQGPPNTARSQSKFALRRMVLSAAVANASVPTSTSEDRAFAQDIEKRITALKRSGGGPVVAEISPDKPAAHRWEEGMCEWVAITPAPPPKRARRLSDGDVPSTPGYAAGNAPQAISSSAETATSFSAEEEEDNSYSDAETLDTSPLAFSAVHKAPIHADQQPVPLRRTSGLQVDGTSDDFDGLPSPSRSRRGRPRRG